MSAKHGTFDGRTLTLDTMTHQHISNCIWHFRVWKDASDLWLERYFNELKNRFNGELLPWRPPVQFGAEIQLLRREGMLIRIDDFKSNIIYMGEIIGEVYNDADAKIKVGERDATDREIKNL